MRPVNVYSVWKTMLALNMLKGRQGTSVVHIACAIHEDAACHVHTELAMVSLDGKHLPINSTHDWPGTVCPSSTPIDDNNCTHLLS